MLKAGADKDKARTTDGCTPLFVAAQEGHEKVADLLLKAGADKDKALTTGDNFTALFIATKSGHRDVTLMLLRAGARLTNSKTTALHIAAEHNLLDITDDIVGGRCTDPASFRAFLLSATRARRITNAVAAGTQAQPPPEARPTCLVTNLPRDLDRRVYSFLCKPQYFDDLDYLDKKGKTATQIAQRKGNAAIVEILRRARERRNRAIVAAAAAAAAAAVAAAAADGAVGGGDGQ